MNREEFEKLLKEKENKELDFKSELPESEKLAQLVTSFYNSSGGKIVLGVEDETKRLIGLEEPQKVEHKFTQIVRHWCKLDKEPEIDFVNYRDKNFIVINCPKGKDAPYFVRGEHIPRIRTGSSCVVANKEETARLYREGSSKSQDIFPVENSDIKDLDLENIKKYLKKSKLTKQLNDDYLIELMLKEKFIVKSGKNLVPTIAGVLLFGKNPHLNLTQCEIRADRYVGDSMVEWLDRKDIHGNLSDMIKQAEKFVLKNMRTSAKVVGFNTEFKTEYPLEALREAIVNALAHRDWHSPNAILLRMFNSHIDIINPGELLRPLRISEVIKDDYIPETRNKILVEVLSRFGRMDKRGTGFLRIRESMKNFGLPFPEFEEKQNSFVIKFSNPKVLKISEINEFGLNERQKKAIEYLKEKNKITTKEYLIINLGIKERTARYDLNDLAEKNILIKIGSTASSYYELKSSAKFGKVRQNENNEEK